MQLIFLHHWSTLSSHLWPTSLWTDIYGVLPVTENIAPSHQVTICSQTALKRTDLLTYVTKQTEMYLQKRAHRAIVRVTYSFNSGTTAMTGSITDLLRSLPSSADMKQKQYVKRRHEFSNITILYVCLSVCMNVCLFAYNLGIAAMIASRSPEHP